MRDPSYTPYIPRTDVDDLTYDQILEVMELLNRKDGEVVLLYFHYEADLHAYAKAFDLDFVRAWPSERKLKMWREYEKSQRETLKYARETACVLKKYVDRKSVSGPTNG